MNSNKIPGEQLRKELIANHYSNDFLTYFCNTLINKIYVDGSIKRIDDSSKVVEINLKTRATLALDLYGSISDALLETITTYAYEHLSKEALTELSELSRNLSFLFNATLTHSDEENAVLAISL